MLLRSAAINVGLCFGERYNLIREHSRMRNKVDVDVSDCCFRYLKRDLWVIL